MKIINSSSVFKKALKIAFKLKNNRKTYTVADR